MVDNFCGYAGGLYTSAGKTDETVFDSFGTGMGDAYRWIGVEHLYEALEAAPGGGWADRAFYGLYCVVWDYLCILLLFDGSEVCGGL